MKNGRGGEIRTRDLYVPNVALYQAKLRPDTLTAAQAPTGTERKAAAVGHRKQNRGQKNAPEIRGVENWVWSID